ncbi:MAG: hypothetical protein ABH851_03225 [Methanobacteriota archaeon]
MGSEVKPRVKKSLAEREKVIEGSSYWKMRGDTGNLLLDESERRKHTKDYSADIRDKKSVKKKSNLRDTSLSSGGSGVRYIPRGR